MEKTFLDEQKEKLEAEKQALQKELGSFAKEDPHQKGNWEAKYPNQENGTMEEEADETQEYENRVSLEQNLEVQLKDVQLALEKIEKGTYGICENCGKEIEKERLIALPAARLCVDCNKK